MTTEEREVDILTRVACAGVTFSAGIDAPSGGATIFLSPAQALRFTTDPEGAAADALGVSVGDLRGWQEHQGRVPCGARTKRGSQCRNYESGTGYDDPRAWAVASRIGGLCAVHGGEGAEG